MGNKEILLIFLKCDILFSVRVINLSSGSDGNLTYVESEQAKILIDAGLSCKEIELRLSLLNVSGNQIDAILITHEHCDHIKGLDVFATKFHIKVYAHIDEWNELSLKLQKLPNKQRYDFTSAPFSIKDITISAFKVPHDSVCCVGYSLESNNKRVSFCTDLGVARLETLRNLFGSQLVYLEANHDETMLKNNTHYHASLKQRILSTKGHLSNSASAEAISILVKNGTKQIVLSHLSKENNDPILAHETIKGILASKGIVEGEHIKIDVASTKPGKIYRIS